MSLELSDHSNTKIHTEELAPPFKCNDCEFEGLPYKRLNIHKGKQQQIGVPADGIDNEDRIKGVSLQTFILQGKFAEDPNDEDIPVGETFWHLQEVLYFDRHICFVRKAPEVCLENPFWEYKDIKTEEFECKIQIFFSLGSKIR